MKKSSFSSNAIYNVLYKLLNVLFPLVSIAIISRVLQPTGVGKVSSAQNIVTYFSFIAPLGLAFYGTREVAKHNGTKLNVLFSELILINGISTSICTIAYYVMIFTLPYFAGERILYSVTGLAIVLNYINVDWFYQGKEEYKYIALRSSIVKLVMLLCIIIFIHKGEDYIKYAFITCLATAGNYFFNIIHLKKYNIKIIFSNLNLRKHMSALFLLLASNIAVELYSLVDTTMLSAMCTEAVVGYYTNAMKLTKVSIFVIAAIGGVALPRLASFVINREDEKVKKIVVDICNIMFFFAVPAGLGMISIADKIVIILFGVAFKDAILTVRILSLLFYILTFSNFFGTQVLVAYNEEKKVLVASVCGAITNISLNYFLIPLFEQNGAAIASVISEIVVLTVTVVYVLKRIDLSFSKRFIFTVIISGIAMTVLVFVVKDNITNDLISLVVSIIVAFFSYVGINYILKNEVVLAMVDKIRNR